MEGVSMGMEPSGLSSVLVCVGTITSNPPVRSLTKDPMEASCRPRVPNSLGMGVMIAPGFYLVVWELDRH